MTSDGESLYLCCYPTSFKVEPIIVCDHRLGRVTILWGKDFIEETVRGFFLFAFFTFASLAWKRQTDAK